ncbi:peptidyl-prolyl cis-trans isomerase CYP59-like [Papaver somniferum]|uniref:peptidyl-prolyl cis-trans isomerase CYP59-like n=1 Tax=Papaver somniferum TaxID=3469 RepID=UPI000E6FBBF3|nr:peptidyl-prolyl cis-trans isomerase CYP59-like [Papaver somniferum]
MSLFPLLFQIDDDVRLEDDWVPMEEQLGAGQLEEVIRQKEAHSSAVVLEIVYMCHVLLIGDILDADMKPPENVLFVCKLSPVTEDEDLNTIFSRFGTVVSAEVIRDFKTGDSLNYAFIEFETNEACEQDYFKPIFWLFDNGDFFGRVSYLMHYKTLMQMDNALIDDRRIHVDFSQSVSKLWGQYRRKEHQTGKGRGCFKCGSLDHMAKDCTGDPSVKAETPKYVLKDGNTQRGGNEK